MIVLYLNDFSNKFINQPALHLENQLNLIIIMKVSWKFNYWCISEKNCSYSLHSKNPPLIIKYIIMISLTQKNKLTPIHCNNI